jgi:tetratricopeptide (TPR) repeat protein
MSTRLWPGIATLGLVLLAAGAAGAQTSRGQADWGQEAGTAATAAPAPPPSRTPPAWEAVQRGHRAFLARDFDTALAAYREAAMSTPPLPIAHYFIGCALRAKQQFDEAIESFRTAARLAGDTDPGLRAKALFNVAMTLELKNTYPQAREAWQEYKAFCTTHAAIACFPAVADGRIAQMTIIDQLEQAYAAVRQRIADRERQAAEQAAQMQQQMTP